MATAGEIFTEINYINSFIQKYPYSKQLLNARLDFLQNKVVYINKYAYMCGNGLLYYHYYNDEIMNWSKEKLEKELKDREEDIHLRNRIGSIGLDNGKSLIRRVIKERVLKDFINNHLKMKYTKKIVRDKDDDYELIANF